MVLAQIELVLLFGVGVAFLVVIVALILFAKIFAPWFQAFLAGVPIGMIEILGMWMRKADVKGIVQTLIMAKHADAPLSSSEVEKACLQGVDLEKLALAYVRAKKESMDIAFQDLVDADLECRLAEKLKQ